MSVERGSVLVTGGTSGIGAACVEELEARGYGVWIASRNASRSRTPPSARVTDLDVGRPDVAELVLAERESVERELGPLVGFVHSAGVVEVQEILQGVGEANESVQSRTLDVHYHGARRLAEALAPGFADRGRGAIALIGSAASLRGFPGIAAYAAAKHALLGWARCAAIEAPAGVSIATVCPYYVATPMLEAAIEQRRSALGESREQAESVFRSRNPGGALVRASDVARVVLELVEGPASTNNGRVVVLDGGPARDLSEGNEPGLDLPLTPQSLK